ncbi:receptor protein-tyrosine kinase CEPR1-like [Durio zibethinus]|uniref:Receptor protein-tyrosine kinase CEPR1-like n=1 Tax=Durio zibethinus TaxID=66656 RepID=A0A6P5Y9X5_DURZI|nr:receptor protein-tyrosine kinase CEPR1-like [Durio zibethinus]
MILDSEFEPKIADIGMAKLACDLDSSSTRSAIVGTLGYIAPENAYSTRLTEKCDVYGYGVILLEILCGKLPVDPCFEDDLDIVSCTRNNLLENEEYVCFLDKEISLWLNDKRLKALDLLELALQCTQSMADRRPSMGIFPLYLRNSSQRQCSGMTRLQLVTLAEVERLTIRKSPIQSPKPPKLLLLTEYNNALS